MTKDYNTDQTRPKSLDVHIDHAVPLVDLQAIERRLRHEPGIVDHHIDPPVGLNCAVDQSFDLLVVGDVCRHGERIAALVVDLTCQ